MADRFGRYEEDLVELVKSIKIKIADEIPISEKDKRKALIRQCTKESDELSSIIADMEFEITKSGPNSRMSMTNRLKQYKLDVELIQKDLKKASVETYSSKSYDFSGSSSQKLDPERKKILQIQNSLKNAGESVARSTQIAVETENIGTSVLGELNDQGEKLKGANVRLDDTNAALSKSRRLINSLSRGVFYNKFLLVIIIILEVCILGGVIYWKFFS